MKAILLLVLGGVILGWVLGAIVPLHGVITVIINLILGFCSIYLGVKSLKKDDSP